MDRYKEFVRNLAVNNTPKEFLNSDQAHALEVFVNLFNNAKEDIRIFAACLCAENNSDHVANEPRYIMALSDFIEKGGRVHILLNQFDPSRIHSSSLMRRLMYYASKEESQNRIEIRSTLKKFSYTHEDEKEVHFTIMDKQGYRIENDIEKRTAICNFNNPTQALELVRLFDNVFTSDTESQLIDLPQIFGVTKKQEDEARGI